MDNNRTRYTVQLFPCDKISARTDLNMNREDIIKIYAEAVESLPDIKIKGKASAYTSLNGHMFSFVDGENNLSVRLPKEVQEEIINNKGGSYSIQYGATMRGYAMLPIEIINDKEELKNLFQISYEYIQSLNPKPTKKKKK